MERCFVTGGAGFIGSHIVDRLLEDGKKVTVYDNLSLGFYKWIEHHEGSPNFTFVKADLRDLPALTKAMAGHDTVWHMGANTEIPRGNKDPNVDLENTTIATSNVLEAMRATGIKQVLFASSACVYGDHPVRPFREDLGPLQPISLYGAGKLAGEAMISSYVHLFDFRAWIFRFGNVVGARMGHGVIRDFIHKLQNDPQELIVLGDGNQEKNYFLVEDCVAGMLFAFKNSPGPVDIYNLGNATTTKVTRIAQIIIEAMGLRDVRISYTGGQRGWPGDQPQIRYDVSKMARLGFVARQDSDDSVRTAAHRLLGKTEPALSGKE
jgi:UDP-glucose 4-epimerase